MAQELEGLELLGLSALCLQLDCGVPNIKIFAEGLLRLGEDLPMISLSIDDCMGAEGKDPGGHSPDMEVMDFLDSRDCFKACDDG